MKPQYKTGQNLIRINLANHDGSSTFHLDYRLYDHSVARKWMKLLQQTLILDGGKISRDGIFSGNGINDKADLIQKLDNTVEFHNQFCRENNYLDCIIPIKTDHPVTQDRLSKLHEYFEQYAEDHRFSSVTPVRENLQDMNLMIHALESCLDESSKACHVEILSQQVLKQPLVGDDYKLFDLDSKWGQLVLTYGITGVPTLNAFRNNSEPTPQNYVTNGMTLAFWGDFTFDRHAELEAWLKTKGMDINNPECALGYVGLGVLENLDSIDRDELLKKIAKHQKVTGYVLMLDKNEIPKPLPVQNPIPSRPRLIETYPSSASVQWPFDQEIFYHLDLVPYIDLNVTFDSKKLFDEAFKARDYFVVHRDYDQQSGETFGKWKSLGLRSLFGDYTKTQYHTSYTFEGKPEYMNTVFSELCPETMKFLNSITDVTQCERVRFMLLEPGASINVHRDSKERDVSLAVNISLNMPEGCEFHAQVNPDGTLNEHSVKLPFKDSGSVLLFNNAKYHRVVNNSNTPRIHIIFHGPTRFSDEVILKLARAQNKIPDRKELMKRLIQKKASLGEELTKTPTLFSDWLSSGLNHDSLPHGYALAVYDHDTYHVGGTSELYLKKRTAPTLFPLGYKTIKESDWDTFLKESYSEGREFAVIIAAGSFVLDISLFIKELVINCQELKKENQVAAGHLMDFNKDHLPYFHEQFLIVNLKAWNDIGQPSLGPLFDMNKSELIDAEIASEKVHDDYTPLYIRASKERNGKVTRRGLLGWGSGLIKKAVESGLGVMNLNSGLRLQKIYSYPRDTMEDGRKKIDVVINEKLRLAKNEVYCFNNEILGIIKAPELGPTKLISVAAGFKPFHIMKQFGFSEGSKIHFVDFSPNALSYINTLSKQTTTSGVEQVIQGIVKIGATRNLSPGVAESLLKGTIRDYFNNDSDTFFSYLHLAKKASFEEVNLIQEHEKVTTHLQEGDRFIIWTSNAFYNNQLYLLMTPEEANQHLINLVIAIAKKTSFRAYRLRNSYTFAFGKGLDFIRGILTDGAAQEAQFSREFWDEIKY